MQLILRNGPNVEVCGFVQLLASGPGQGTSNQVAMLPSRLYTVTKFVCDMLDQRLCGLALDSFTCVFGKHIKLSQKVMGGPKAKSR